MIRYIICLLSVILFSQHSNGQERYFTNQGYISFYSHTPVEDIKAENNQVLCILDISTGEMAITLLMKSFSFEKALMQEHFNENYVESDKYPKANFTGKIVNLEKILSGDQNFAIIKGVLTIKDVTKPIEVESKITLEKESILLKGKFMVTVADYNIKIPAIVRKNIAREVEVRFHFNLKPVK